MHPEQIRTGMWVRIEDVTACTMPTREGQVFVHSQQLSNAQHNLSAFGGIPLQVLAVHYPFCLLKLSRGGLLMVDMRFNRLGKADEKFVNVFKRLRARNNSVLLEMQVAEQEQGGDENESNGKAVV